eukprot:sb/3466902/
MTLINQCSRLLARSNLRNLSTRFALPKSGPKIRYNYGAVGLLGAAVFSMGAALVDGQISADELELGHAHMHWEFNEMFKSYDHKALRRGFQVYKEVCQACHSMQYLYWRMHVDVTHDVDTMKEFAAEYQYPDVDDDGNNVMRAGDIQDFMPAPYENEIKARLANNGALPPDLSLITIAREGGSDYLFALLNGYEELPAGAVEPAEGVLVIYNESVDYEDGTIPYASQIAKDVCEYLAWTSNPYMDESKLYGMKAIASITLFGTAMYLLMRVKRSHMRLRQLAFAVPGKEKSISALPLHSWERFMFVQLLYEDRASRK